MFVPATVWAATRGTSIDSVPRLPPALFGKYSINNQDHCYERFVLPDDQGRDPQNKQWSDGRSSQERIHITRKRTYC